MEVFTWHSVGSQGPNASMGGPLRLWWACVITLFCRFYCAVAEIITCFDIGNWTEPFQVFSNPHCVRKAAFWNMIEMAQFLRVDGWLMQHCQIFSKTCLIGWAHNARNNLERLWNPSQQYQQKSYSIEVVVHVKAMLWGNLFVTYVNKGAGQPVHVHSLTVLSATLLLTP